MARTTGPLMSLGASGSVAKTITFASWKGRSYVRHLVIPANPKTPLQVSTRAMMRFLAQQWATYVASDDQQSSWHALAESTKISNFNAYVAAGMKKWTNSQLPQDGLTTTKIVPPTLGTLAGVGAAGSVSLSQVITTANDIWGVVFFMATSTPANNRTDMVAVAGTITGADGETITASVLNVQPGTYEISSIGFSGLGAQSSPHAPVTGIVVS